MGCFDEVIVACPKCHTNNMFQTKAGRCDFTTYRLAKVPPPIAGSLANEEVACVGCSGRVRFDVQFIVTPYIDDSAAEQDTDE